MRRIHILAPALRATARSRLLNAGIAVLALQAAAFGDTFTFNTDPLAGTIARNVPQRLLIGGEQFIPFNPATDIFAFGPVIFGGDTQIHLANGAVDSLPASANVVVLQTLDDDNNPQTPFGAFNAADLIAGKVTAHTPGVFIFFNQDLQLSELIYSDDLASNQADLRVLVRMIGQFGQEAIQELPAISGDNFAMADPPSPAPEPSTIGLFGAAIGMIVIGAGRKRKRLTKEQRFA